MRVNKYKEQLSNFSPWLAQYHWYGGENVIELPGQHTGNIQPNPNNTIKIVKFHETVTIYKSLRMPIKLIADCSDGIARSFLIKYVLILNQFIRSSISILH